MTEEQAEKHTGEKGNITISVRSGDFPLHLWKEWNKDCKENFNDIRWAKMMSDHKAAQREKLWTWLIGKINILEQRMDRIEGTSKTEEEPLTIGGETND